MSTSGSSALITSTQSRWLSSSSSTFAGTTTTRYNSDPRFMPLVKTVCDEVKRPIAACLPKTSHIEGKTEIYSTRVGGIDPINLVPNEVRSNLQDILKECVESLKMLREDSHASQAPSIFKKIEAFVQQNRFDPELMAQVITTLDQSNREVKQPINREIRQPANCSSKITMSQWQEQLKECVESLKMLREDAPASLPEVFNKIEAFIVKNQFFTKTRKGLDYARVCEGLHILIETIKDNALLASGHSSLQNSLEVKCVSTDADRNSNEVKDMRVRPAPVLTAERMIKLIEMAITPVVSTRFELLPKELVMATLPHELPNDLRGLEVIFANPHKDAIGPMLAHWINSHWNNWFFRPWERNVPFVLTLEDDDLMKLIIDHTLLHSNLLNRLTFDDSFDELEESLNRKHFALEFCRKLVSIHPETGYKFMLQCLARTKWPDLEVLSDEETEAMLLYAECIDVLNWYSPDKRMILYAFKLINVVLEKDPIKGSDLLAKSLPLLVSQVFSNSLQPTRVDLNFDQVIYTLLHNSFNKIPFISAFDLGSVPDTIFLDGFFPILKKMIGLDPATTYQKIAENLHALDLDGYIREFTDEDFRYNTVRDLLQFVNVIPKQAFSCWRNRNLLRKIIDFFPEQGYKLLAVNLGNLCGPNMFDFWPQDLAGILKYIDDIPVEGFRDEQVRKVILTKPDEEAYREVAQQLPYLSHKFLLEVDKNKLLNVASEIPSLSMMCAIAWDEEFLNRLLKKNSKLRPCWYRNTPAWQNEVSLGFE